MAPIDLTAGGFQGRQSVSAPDDASTAGDQTHCAITRHDDTVANLLRLETDSSLAMRQTLYRNLLDLMMQNRESTMGDSRPNIFATLERLRPNVDPDVRYAITRRIGRQRLPQQHDLIAWLLGDPAVDPADVLGRVQLDDVNWHQLLPKLDAIQRGVLNNRTDLNDVVVRAFASLGQPVLLLQHSSEHTTYGPKRRDAEQLFGVELSTPSPVAELSDEAQQQVRDLIQRIDEFRQERERKPASVVRLATVEQAMPNLQTPHFAEAATHNTPANDDLGRPAAEVALLACAEAAAVPTLLLTSPLADVAAVISDWRWETDRFGIFVHVEAGTLTNPVDAKAVPSLKGQALLDWCTSSPTLARIQKSLQRRCGFRNAPVPIVDGPLSGLWSMSAVPVFEAGSGVFTGYRGTATRQRPMATIDSIVSHSVPPPNKKAAEILAAMAHETRTPLNAIMGYAELIEMQPFGKINEAYHKHAAAILEESNKLLRALDDVSDSARLEQGAYPLHAAPFDMEILVTELVAEFEPVADRNGVALTVKTNSGLPMIWSDHDVIHRCVGRLIFAMLSTAHRGEALTLSLRAAKGDHIQFSITRPELLRGVKTEAMFDPLTHHEGTVESPTHVNAGVSSGLGIGFGLRLVRQLAMAIGGRLDIDEHSLNLLLPAAVQLTALKVQS